MKHNKVKVIGITGGIASGKSTFSNILREKGYVVIDADELSRDLLKKTGKAYKDVINKFGREILNKDKTINRKVLASLIFKKKAYRDDLEEILHPYIFKKIKRSIDYYSKREDLIFVDIPLLYEKYDKLSQYSIFLDEVWLVYIDRESQIERLMRRDNINLKEAINKIDTQMDIKEKEKLADKVIYNTRDLENLEIAAEELLKAIQ